MYYLWSKKNFKRETFEGLLAMRQIRPVKIALMVYTGSCDNAMIMPSTLGSILASIQSVLISLTPVKKCTYCSLSLAI